MGVRVNLAGVEGGFEPVPSGKYPLNVVSGEIRESNSDKHVGAEYIAWGFTIAGGDFEDRWVWDNTIIRHDWVDEDGNEAGCQCGDEENIAKFNKGLFKIVELLKATGKWTDEELDSEDFELDISEVEGSQVAAILGIRKSDEYGDQNTIRKYKPIGSMELADSSMLP